MFIIGKKMNEAACSWGWFLCWLKDDHKHGAIQIMDQGDYAIIKIGDRITGDWLSVKDAIDELKLFFKYHYMAELSFGCSLTPDAFESLADERWKELLSVLITRGKDEILIKKY